MKPMFLYNSMLRDVFAGGIDFGTTPFRMLLVTDRYRPDQRSHARRSDIEGEAEGAGYPAGGVPVEITVEIDAQDVLTLSSAKVEIPKASVTARGCVICVDRGGPAEDDELIAYVDFGVDFTASNGPYTVEPQIFTFEN